MHLLSNWFLQSYQTLPEHSWRKVRILFFSTLISIVFTMSYAFIGKEIGFAAAFFSMIIISVLFFLLLIGLRLGLPHKVLAWAYIFISWITLDYLILYSGGILSYILPWMALLPVLSLLFLDYKVSVIWTIIGGITILIFWFGESYLPIQTFLAPKEYLVSLSLGLLLLLLIVTRIFEKQQLILVSKVEERNEELRATEEELRQNLEEMRSLQEVLALRESESRSIINALEKYFYISEYDGRGKTLRVNAKLIELTGLMSPGDIGKSTKSLIDVSDWTVLEKNWSKILSGESVNQEFHAWAKGNEFWMSITFAPIINRIGQLQRVIAVGHEITLMKRQELEIKSINFRLRESLAALEKQNRALQLKRNEIEESKIRLDHYTHELMRFTQMPALHVGEFGRSLSEILRTSASTLNTSRLSLWKYMESEKAIQCIQVYHQRGDRFESGFTLYQKDLPIYFEAILKEQIIVANDARKEHATYEFNLDYLGSNNIFSMLDVPLVFDGKLYGVLCCEQEENIREWNAEDVTFAKSVADIIVLAMSAAKRRENEVMIVEQNKKIQNQNEELKKFSEEIKAINQSLEARVQQRTEALENQNMKLSEYAFVNAHLLRGPLCRILGLVDILEFNRMGNDAEKVYKFLRQSTDELDGVVKKITSLLDDGLYFDRKEFNRE